MKQQIETFNNTKVHFLELHGVSIKITFIPMYFATMNSRPCITSFLFPWRRHNYIISINSRKNFSRYSVPTGLLNETILTGWFAHELGHIIQYERMNLAEFVAFPFKYFFSLSFRKNFEIEATDIAKEIGFGNEFSEVENFLRSDKRVNKKYQERFKKFYVLD